MGLISTDPVATVSIGYDKALPIKTVKRKQPIDDLKLEYFVELPNGERLRETYNDSKVNVKLDIGYIWEVNEQKYHGHKWGHETTAHFTLLVDKTGEEKGILHGLEYKIKQNLPEAFDKLDKKAIELLATLRKLGLSPKKSDLYLLISASQE
ncbi:MAG: hypothetical protein V1645_03960 [archaeon]